MPRDKLAAALKAALAKAGHESTYAAAKATGLESRQLGQILKGEVSPTLDTVERILSAINYEIVFQRTK